MFSMRVLKKATREKVVFLPRFTMRNPVSNGLTCRQVVANDGVQSKSPICDKDMEEKRSPSTLYSMRGSRTSDELERDGGLVALKSSTRESIVAPLNPVTPLRWKSSKRLENERKKLQEEIKNNEAGKEEMKDSKFVNDIKKEQNKTKIVLTSEVNGIKISNKADTSITNHATSQEEAIRPLVSSNTSESVVPTQAAKTSFKGNSSRHMGGATWKAAGNQQETINHVKEKSTDMKPSPLKTNGCIDERPTNRKEVPPLNAEHANDQCNTDVSGLDRKPHTGDESPVITVDFLRARLLAERASSKAAKDRIELLTKKVLDLERKLDQEIQLKKKAEEAAQEALLEIQSLGERAPTESSKYTECDTNLLEKSMEPSHTCETAKNMLLPEKDELVTPYEENNSKNIDKESANWVEGEIQVIENCVDDAKPCGCVALKLSDIPSSTLEIGYVNDQVTSENITSMPKQENGELQTLQRSGSNDSKKVKEETRVAPGVISATDGTVGCADSGIRRQDRRLIVELRLRNMWDQMTQEMAALAEDKNQEEVVREELFTWMGQVPSVLQDVLPKLSEDKKLLNDANTGKEQLKDVNASPTTIGTSTTRKEDAGEDHSLDEAQFSKLQAKELKKVATLIERFEAQENIQREWDQNYIQQNSTSRRGSGEASMSKTNSSPGTPHPREYQQETQQEQSPRTLPQLHDPRYYRHITASPISPHHGTREHNLLAGGENGKVVSYYSQNASPSIYLDPPTVEEMEGRSGEEGTNSGGNHGTKNSMLHHTQFGMERPPNPSYITTTHLGSSSSVTSGGENNCDITNSQVDRSQFLEQSNHYHCPSASLEERHESPPGHSGRINTESVEPSRSRSLAGWVKQEEPHIFEMSTNKGNSSSQWDVSIMDRHQQLGKLATCSQVGNNNAYIRPEVPCNYPLRNDEREVYRGRMESVSRSMEGLEGSWRSLSDPEGYDILPYAHVADSADSGIIISRSGSQTPFQVHGGSARSIHYQAEYMMDKSLSVADYGQEFSGENFQRRPSSKSERTASKVNDLLKALQLAKLSIQNPGARRTSILNLYEPSLSRYTGGENHNVEANYVVDGGVGITNGSSAAPNVWSNMEDSRRYSVGEYREYGSTRCLRPENSGTFDQLISARRKEAEEDCFLADRSSPA